MKLLQKLFGKYRSPSIKEGMDNLPFGIVFANSVGIVILCNHVMHRVSNALQGRELQNADFFWKLVEERGTKTQNGAYLLRFADGTVWLLKRRECMLNGGLVYEISARDETERMCLIDRVSEDNRHLASIGMRLRQYDQNAQELARSRELLERKEYIHDELGKLLSATRHYLDGGEVDGAVLWHRWHINAALMLEEAGLPAERDFMESLRNIAGAVGVRLIITGDEPRGSRTREMMLAAGGECVTNLLRHTRGVELYLRVENRKGMDVLIFTDNGMPPEEEVKEGGGLSALRRKVEDIGGMMEVRSMPAYQLILTIPIGNCEMFSTSDGYRQNR